MVPPRPWDHYLMPLDDFGSYESVDLQNAKLLHEDMMHDVLMCEHALPVCELFCDARG